MHDGRRTWCLLHSSFENVCVLLTNSSCVLEEAAFYFMESVECYVHLISLVTNVLLIPYSIYQLFVCLIWVIEKSMLISHEHEGFFFSTYISISSCCLKIKVIADAWNFKFVLFWVKCIFCPYFLFLWVSFNNGHTHLVPEGC